MPFLLCFIAGSWIVLTGATIASITVALDVPRKNDPNSIIVKLGRLADTANTISNRGLKDLVTAGTFHKIKLCIGYYCVYYHNLSEIRFDLFSSGN